MSRLINFHALHVVVFPDHRFLQLIVLFLLFETQNNNNNNVFNTVLIQGTGVNAHFIVKPLLIFYTIIFN